MLMMSMNNKFHFQCAACKGLIVDDGLAIYTPLHEKTPTSTTVVVHRGCTKAPIVQYFFPTYSSRPLRQVLQQLDETLAVEEK